MTSDSWHVLRPLLVLLLASSCAGRTAFEKLTEYDFRGTTYYTIQNLSLWECQGWCKEEPECAAASFSFVINPLAPVQETLCLLQNETMAANPSAVPKRAVSLYYMIKLTVRSDNVCNRPWQFERVPSKRLAGLDNAHIHANSKQDCLAACLNEKRFVCRSAEYSYATLQCHLSEHDRRTVDAGVGLEDAAGVDYFENLCLGASDSCRTDRTYKQPSLGVPEDQVSHYVDMHYYVDKEVMANSVAACQRACEIETDFLCRSYLYKGPPSTNSHNCQLFHLDHYTLPDGADTYQSTDRPLLDDGERTGTYFENVCARRNYNMICKQVTTRDKRYITQIMCFDKSTIGRRRVLASRKNGQFTNRGTLDDSSNASAMTGQLTGSSNDTGGPVGASITGESGYGGDSASSSTFSPDPDSGTSDGDSGDINCDPTGVCYDVSVHCKDTRIAVEVATNRPFNGRIYALGRSETCNIAVINSDKFRLDLTMAGQDCNTQSVNGVYTNTVVIQHHSVVMTKTDKIYKIRCTYDMSPKNITFGMMPIRQDGLGEDVSNRLVVRDPDMIPITSAPEAPPPRIRILDAALREVETVRIGDRLTFRIEIPEQTPYGIFARSCVAMAKDSRSTFQIIDDDGCPVEPAIFPEFTKVGSALQSMYDAFRFTESYGVIFQCNVKYCLGSCEPARCKNGRDVVRSYGRRKRNVRSLSDGRGHVQETTKEAALAAAAILPVDASEAGNAEEEMSISQEILVLDLGEEAADHFKTDPHQVVEEEPYYTATNKVNLFETCPTRSSVLALAVTCAILLLIYVLTVFYFVMRKWIRPQKSLR
ncbi:uncharacterized protein LOC108682449 isoform X5 [Hyalella azteca]|uniref:Uncharacterized protein LOC108682449 isoform X5 n=1 Tax=Hyalella azteca TaxID=294128 RepID=A0A8B7PNU3_HYAAZ|nr:uncharacterized protein LOC108682449 isoform X5 [Hyalella azteca]